MTGMYLYRMYRWDKKVEGPDPSIKNPWGVLTSMALN